MFKFFKNWLAKEAFYKNKFEESSKKLDHILKNIKKNQAEIEILKPQNKKSLKSVEKAMNALSENYESNLYSNRKTGR